MGTDQSIDVIDWVNAKTAQDYIKENKWGYWTYEWETHTLNILKEYKGHLHDYQVDLDECTTSSELLDWIYQLNTKSWIEPQDLGDFIRATDDILEPQAHLCSCGRNLKFKVTRFLDTSVDVYFKKFPNFGQFLRSRVNERSATGDIARDYLARNADGKRCCARHTSYRGLKKHIQNEHTPCDAAINALDNAHREFEAQS